MVQISGRLDGVMGWKMLGVFTLIVLSDEPLTILVSSNCTHDTPWVWPSNVRTLHRPPNQLLRNRNRSENTAFHWK